MRWICQSRSRCYNPIFTKLKGDENTSKIVGEKTVDWIWLNDQSNCTIYFIPFIWRLIFHSSTSFTEEALKCTRFWNIDKNKIFGTWEKSIEREREREETDRGNWFPLHQRLRIMRVTIYAHKGNKAYESTLYQTWVILGRHNIGSNKETFDFYVSTSNVHLKW